MSGEQNERGATPLWAWLARACAAAALVAVLELLLIALVFVTAVSSGLAALQTWAQLALLLGIYAVPAALLLWQADRPAVRRWLPRGSSLLAGLLLGALATLALRLIDGALFERNPEFPEYIERMRGVARLALLALLLAVVLSVHARLRARLKTLSASTQRAMAAGALLFGALVALWTGHFAFAPVHEVPAAAVCTLAATLIVTATFRVLDWPKRALDARAVVGTVVLVGVLGVALPGSARDHARSVVWGHASVAGLAERLRGALDWDHDAVLPAWLAGGGDCAPSDPAIGPLQLEIPGDGVDQDCRGGDAARVDTRRDVAVLPAGCTALEPKPDVLVLAIDALRFDALGPETMPFLTELAKGSQLFTRAYSPTGMTITSVSAIFAGRPFADVGPRNALLDERLAPPFTAAEMFARAGYRTAAFSDFFDNAVFRRGFAALNSYWRDGQPTGVKGKLTSVAQARGLLELLEAGKQPAFAWVHIADTHANYSLRRDGSGAELSEQQAYYRGAHYVDAQLGRLLAVLRERGRLERTIIAVLADHGEELGARGREGHGPNLFEESIHVPLVLWVPGCAPRVVTSPVSVAHVMPTLAALAGVTMPGVGLFQPTDLPTVAEGVTGLSTTYKRAVIGERYKLMLDVTNGGRMLFDLKEDPDELTDVLADQPDQAAELERAYQKWLDASGHR